jgi:hypothetical protein
MITRGNIIRTLRLVASFALLGTVTSGALFGHNEMGTNIHLAGAGIGATLGIVIKATHLV